MRPALALATGPLLLLLAGCADPSGIGFEAVAACEQPRHQDIDVGRPDVQDLWTMVLTDQSEADAYCPSGPSSLTVAGQAPASRAPPSVEAGEQVLLHVQWDNRPSTGYGIIVEDVRDLPANSGTRAEVRVLLLSPGSGCGAGRAFTNPSAAIVVDWPEERGQFRPVIVPLQARQDC